MAWEFTYVVLIFIFMLDKNYKHLHRTYLIWFQRWSVWNTFILVLLFYKITRFRNVKWKLEAVHIVIVVGETKPNFLFPNSSVLSIEQFWLSTDRVKPVIVWRRALAYKYRHSLLSLQRDLIWFTKYFIQFSFFLFLFSKTEI